MRPSANSCPLPHTPFRHRYFLQLLLEIQAFLPALNAGLAMLAWAFCRRPERLHSARPARQTGLCQRLKRFGRQGDGGYSGAQVVFGFEAVLAGALPLRLECRTRQRAGLLQNIDHCKRVFPLLPYALQRRVVTLEAQPAFRVCGRTGQLPVRLISAVLRHPEDFEDKIGRIAELNLLIRFFSSLRRFCTCWRCSSASCW